MRILHTADLHLGRQFNGIALDDDHAAVLDQILATLKEERADVLIIAGDVFDRAAPPASAVRQFNGFLGRVARETGAALVMIAGNHDSADRIGAMSIMPDSRRALIAGPLDGAPEPLILVDEHGPVAFSALPFGFEGAAREAFGDETIANPEDVLAAQVEAARARVPQGTRWVIVAHAFVAGGCGSEGERPLARVGGVETVRPHVFGEADYVALGHLHRPQAVGEARIRYAGAPLAFSFEEAGGAKSMAVVDIGADGLAGVRTVDFVPRRGVRVLRGMLAELIEGAPSADFVRAELMDEHPRIDPMRRLREVFPNACQLVYARDLKAPEAKSAPAANASLSDPIMVIDDFLRHVREERLREDEWALVAGELHGLQREDAA